MLCIAGDWITLSAAPLVRSDDIEVLPERFGVIEVAWSVIPSTVSETDIPGPPGV